MTLFLSFYIIVLVVVVMIVWVWWRKKYEIVERELRRTQKELEKERELFNGFDEYNREIAQLKSERKQKIMDEIQKQGGINAHRAADLIEISRFTAFRYLEELEQEGKIKQVGSFGRRVIYKLK